jgi:hypothetical protein
MCKKELQGERENAQIEKLKRKREAVPESQFDFGKMQLIRIGDLRDEVLKIAIL